MMKLCLVEDVFGCCPRLVGKVTRWDKRLLAARTGWAWIEREELVSFFFASLRTDEVEAGDPNFITHRIRLGGQPARHSNAKVTRVLDGKSLF
ncbi:uncharacterized protein DS421_11g339050 [Arachis hypogaea]|nr:uncharacterized protein DS421_11g339050 [Arachis hypogaea]QHO20565.1 uncharacterized protein DS421_11g339050 [Arachis hypogaea]